MRARARSSLHRLVRAATNAFAALGFLLVFVTLTPVLSFWIHWLSGPRWDAPAGDVLIVLGAEGPSDDMIGHSTYWRSFYAVRAWRQARFTKVIVTGDEAMTKSMADYMTSQGVPTASIERESKSINTQENVANSLRLVTDKRQRIAVLSSDYHMLRTYRCFRKLGVDPLCVPAPDAGKRYNSLVSRWSVFGELVVETAKLLRYRVLGYV